MTTGEDRNKDPYKNLKHCGLWKLRFRHHGAIKLTQSCVCFSNPCINPFVPTSVTVETTSRQLNVFMYCIIVPLNCRIHCLGHFERHNTSIIFSADFRSCLVARIRKPIKYVLKTLLRRSTRAVPILPEKPNSSSCTVRTPVDEGVPTVTPSSRRLWLSLSNSNRPGHSKFFGRGPHKLLHNSSRAGHLV